MSDSAPRTPPPTGHFSDTLLLGVLAALVFLPEWLGGGSAWFCKVDEFYAATVNRPWDAFMREEWAAGRFPLWNPYTGLGAPLWANLLSAPMAVLKWPVLLLDRPVAYEALAVARLWVAMTGACLLSRRMGCGRLASAVGGIAFGLCGHFLRYRNETYLHAEMLAPWVAWAAMRIADAPTRANWLAMVLLMTLVTAGGNPEAIFWIYLLGLFSLAVLTPRGPMRWLPLMALSGMTALLAAIMLLPFAEYFASAVHFLHPRGMGFLHFHLRDLPLTLMPWFHGDVHNAGFAQPLPDYKAVTETLSPLTYQAGAIRRWVPNYIGVSMAVLGLAGLLRFPRWEMEPGRRRWLVMMAVWGALALCWAWGVIPISLALHLPPLDRLNHTKHGLVILYLALAMLAALMVDRHRRNPATEGPALLRMSVILLAGVGASALLMARGIPQGPAAKAALTALLALVPAIAAASARSTKAASIASLLMAAGLFAELWTLNRGHAPLPPDEVGAFESIVWPKELREPANGPVWVDSDIYPPHLSMLAGVRDLRMLDGLYPARWASAIQDAEGLDEAALFNRTMAEGGVLSPGDGPRSFLQMGRLGVGRMVLNETLPTVQETPERILHSAQIEAPDRKKQVGIVHWRSVEGPHKALFAHPPALIRYEIPAVPAIGLWVMLRPVMDPMVAGMSDGVRFKATYVDKDGATVLMDSFLKPEEALPAPLTRDCKARYMPDGTMCVSIPPNMEGRLTLETGTGPDGDFDWAGWQVFVGFAGDWPLGERFVREDDAGGNPVYRNPEAAPWLGPGWTLAGWSTQKLAFSRDATGEPKTLTMGDLHFPGWRAFAADGTEIAIIPDDGKPSRRVEVPASTNAVVMRYEPWAFRLSLWLMVGTLVSYAGLVRRRALSAG